MKQEIYARVIMYNFGIFIANNVSRESKKTKRYPDNKYIYEIDFSMAIKNSRKFFRRSDKAKPIQISCFIIGHVVFHIAHRIHHLV